MLLSFDSSPVSIQGRTLVPLRTIFEELGMEVTWDGTTKTISGKKDGVEIKLQQDSKTAYVNGNQIMLDVPAQAIQGRILVPVRFIAESTGAKIFWEEKNRTIYMSTSNDETLTLDRILTSSSLSNEGWKQKQAGKTKDALKYFERAIELDPFNCNAYYQQGVTLESENMYEEALKCYDNSLQINPKTYFIHQSKAMLLFKLEKYKEAARSYEEVAKSSNNRFMEIIVNNLGDKLFYSKNYEDSILYFDIAIKYFPDKADKAYFNKAVSLHYLFRYEEALQCYDKAIEINPEFSFAYSNKGNVYKDLGKLDEAIKWYDKAIELTPEDSEPYICKGIALLAFKRYAEALDLFDKAILVDVKDIRAYDKKITALHYLNRSEEALKFCDTAIEIFPNSPLIYRTKGNLYHLNQKLIEAVEMYDKAIELNTNKESLSVYSDKGTVLYELKRYEDALLLFDKSIETGFINEYVFNLKGNTLSSLGKTMEALECYNKAIELNKKFAVTYFNKAVLYANLNNENEALASLKKAIELDSNIKNIARNWPSFRNLIYNIEFNKLVNE
jgi:tetratricopeptide (TPR) repeat protein